MSSDKPCGSLLSNVERYNVCDFPRPPTPPISEYAKIKMMLRHKTEAELIDMCKRRNLAYVGRKAPQLRIILLNYLY